MTPPPRPRRELQSPRSVRSAIAPVLVAGTLLGVAAGAWLVGPARLASPGSASAAPQPNLIVIQTDDQTLASLNRKTMPATMSLLADRGTTFSGYVVSSPLCCPSRASLLTGQYPHNHGIVSNAPGYAKLRGKGSTLPAWLGRAGYRTAHVGKFLHHYDRHAPDPTRAPAGWDEWATMLPPYSYFGYELAVNGRRKRFGEGRGDYLTTVLNRHATRIVREGLARPEPLFLALDQFAPHGQSEQEKGSCGLTATPLPGDFRRFARERLPAPPSFDEEDVSDKPPFRRLLERLPEARVKGMRENYRCRLASIRAVDRGVRRLHAAVKQAGQLDRTVFVFTSDNGFLQGEHRVPAQKAQTYEEALRVPMVIRAPRAVLGGTPRAPAAPQTTSNIDLAPTILELAGAKPCRRPGVCRTLDGRSLVPLLRGDADGWPPGRGILVSFSGSHRKAARSQSCRFHGVRTAEHTYVEHDSVPNPSTSECERTFERELYDLRADPYQLENLEREDRPSSRSHEAAELSARLANLRRCAGVAGRDERKRGRPFCE